MALEQVRQLLQDSRDALGEALAHVEDAIAGQGDAPSSSSAGSTVAPPGESFADTLETGDHADVAAEPAAPVFGQHDPAPPAVVGATTPDEPAASTEQETDHASVEPAATPSAPAGPPATDNL